MTISDTLFSVDAALEGVGLAYTFEQLAEPHIRAKRLKRVLTEFSPTFPGFYLYYPSRHDQPTKLKVLVEYVARAKTVRSATGIPIAVPPDSNSGGDLSAGVAKTSSST